MDPKTAPHLLLIEDNPGDADLIRLRLVEAGSELEVACVNRLSSGIESLAERIPAVVLLDLNLPDSHGADTFRSVLKKAPTVPIVVLSGLEDESLATKAIHQGVQEYLVKGRFDHKQLSRAIRSAIERQALLTSLDMSRKQQLQFKDDFLSHVSHELRTPLTCIHQFVTILLDGLAGEITGEKREHLNSILGSANQLRVMIDDLLEATRAEAGKLQVELRPTRIAEPVQQAVAMLTPSANEKNIELVTEIDSGLSLVLADPERVVQIMVNLLDNGLKFSEAGGRVVVKAGLAANACDYACISVADTGKGISPETKHLIFERLYQDPSSNQNSRKGLGLGLYIVQELVNLHAGRLWVESQLGRGSVFSFTLPLFTLTKLLAPLMPQKGGSAKPLSLISLELSPKPAKTSSTWSDARQQCTDILRSSISGKDVLLPVIGSNNGPSMFLIVASTNDFGADALLKRIADQLYRSPEMQAQATFTLSTVPLSDNSETLLAEVAAAMSRGEIPTTSRPKVSVTRPSIKTSPRNSTSLLEPTKRGTQWKNRKY